MKRTLYGIVALILSCGLLLCGCSGDTPEETTAETEETTATTEDPTKAKDISVGFIYNDSVENSSLDVFFEEARKELELTLGVKTCYLDEVLVQDFAAAADVLREEGCSVIVSCSAAFSNYCAKLAHEDVKTLFISLGGQDSTPNLAILEPAIYQPANVCGFVAAYNSVSNILGIVADVGMFNCYGVTNSYILGAKEITEAQTDIRFNWAISSDEARTKEAIDDLVTQGCDVIMLYQNSDYGIRYCEEIGVKVIGFAYNMPELAPENYLTGYYINIATYLVDRVRLAQFGNFKGDVQGGGLRAGICGMVQLSENCKEGTADITDVLYEHVRTGKSPIFRGEIKDNYGNVKVDKGATLTHDLVLLIDWLEQSVTNITNFVVARDIDDIEVTDFIIKY